MALNSRATANTLILSTFISYLVFGLGWGIVVLTDGKGTGPAIGAIVAAMGGLGILITTVHYLYLMLVAALSMISTADTASEILSILKDMQMQSKLANTAGSGGPPEQHFKGRTFKLRSKGQGAPEFRDSEMSGVEDLVFVCPNCNNNCSVPAGTQMISCPHCGAELTLS